MEDLYGVFAGLTGQTVESIAEDLKDGSPNNVERWLKEAIRTKVDNARDEGFKRAEKKVLSDVEKVLSKKFEVSEYSGFDDLVTKINPQPIDRDITPEDIRHNPIYLSDLKDLKEAKTKAEQDYHEYVNSVQKKELMTTLAKASLAHLKDGKFKLPTDERILQRRVNEMVNDLLEKADYQIDQDSIIPLQKGGKDRLRDKIQTEVIFKDLAIDIASGIFEIEKPNGGNPAPVTTTDKGSQQQGKKFGITSVSDFYEKAGKINDPNDLKAIEAEFNLLVEAGEIQ